MYGLIKERNIYENIRDKDRIFQLCEIPYNDYEKAIVDTMHHFTMKATTIEFLDRQYHIKDAEFYISLILMILAVMQVLVL